jgi:hypothetical protein
MASCPLEVSRCFNDAAASSLIGHASGQEHYVHYGSTGGFPEIHSKLQPLLTGLKHVCLNEFILIHNQRSTHSLLFTNSGSRTWIGQSVSTAASPAPARLFICVCFTLESSRSRCEPLLCDCHRF